MSSPTPRGRPGITEPVPRPLQRLLREAVIAHVASEHRRVHPPVLHAGVPGRAARRLVLDQEEPLDHALRTDIVEAMVRRGVQQGRVPLLWLTRRDVDHGATAPVDIEWVAAAACAGGELGVRLDLVVVTRHGWHDPRTGVARRWKRLRAR
jgi:hypothetical protein